MPTDPLPPDIQGEAQLDELLSEPSQTALQAMRRIEGDVMLLGVAGKMGPTLARMARRASDAAGPRRRVIGVSRFSTPESERALQAYGVETLRGDLLDESFLGDLPDAPNIIFMTGVKFGSTNSAAQTWATNVYLPTLVCRRFPNSRILAFSTGNVYPLVPIDSGGSRETDPPGPVGEYAMTALGRERMFEYFCHRLSIRTTLLRLNYAVELRYGVLVDIARQVQSEATIDLSMGYVNVIWQGDANAMALAALADADVGPFIVNCSGPELISVRETGEAFGRLLGKTPRFSGRELPTALLNNGSLGHARYGKPTVPLATLIEWIAYWIKTGKPLLEKPTHFQVRDGRFQLSEHQFKSVLRRGTALPAHPLVLTKDRRIDERRQRALSRYYIAAGAGGLAVGVHTTQFAIHDPRVGLYQPVLRLAAEEMDRADRGRDEPLVRVAGIIGHTEQATREAALAREIGYHVGLLGLGAMAQAGEDEVIRHCRAVADVLPVFGFYLQPEIGGRVLPYRFWRRFAEIENVVAIKVAVFDRYRTLDVVRALAESGRDDIVLYTGNDDNIVLDLLTPFRFDSGGQTAERRFVGGLLGHWAFWARGAVKLLEECRRIRESGDAVDVDLLAKANQVTDVNSAVFDATHQFAGCIPGILEVLRRQGLVEGIWCLDDKETLSPGQSEDINRVCAAYSHLTDDAFVAEHRDKWLSG